MKKFALTITIIVIGLSGCTPQEKTVNLYYYNVDKDREIAEYLPCSEDAILPVERSLPNSNQFMEDTIDLLLKGNLADTEIEQGFTTEFPSQNFALTNRDLKDGILTLEFSDPDGFTIGGSCRTGLLRSQIEKTALQFSEVNKVVLLPETLFQP